MRPLLQANSMNVPKLPENVPSQYYGIGLGAIHLLYGLLCTFAGYRTLRALLVITGAIGGALGGWLLAGWLLAGRMESPLPATIAISAVAAIGLAVAFFFLYYVAIFALGAIVAGAVAWLIADPLVADPMVVLGIAVGAAVIGGLLALLLRRPIVIVLTSATGAIWTGLGGLLLLSGGQHPIVQKLIDAAQGQPMPRLRDLLSDPEKIWLRVAICVLFVAGIIVQFITTKKKSDDGHHPHGND